MRVVLVTGSRDFDDETLIAVVLEQQLVTAGGELVVVRHGDYHRGADRITANWIEHKIAERAHVVADPYPAEDYGSWPACGPRRNTAMVNDSQTPDVCCGFFKIGAANKGTNDCVRKAHAAEIALRTYWA